MGKFKRLRKGILALKFNPASRELLFLKQIYRYVKSCLDSFFIQIAFNKNLIKSFSGTFGIAGSFNRMVIHFRHVQVGCESPSDFV